MPAIAAHYEFGQNVLSTVDQHIKHCISCYKNEYNLGLQGPDIFFYYKPYRNNVAEDYGHLQHCLSGNAFFKRRLNSFDYNKRALAYLMGVACHYSLDSACHKYINEVSSNIKEHHFLETCYDTHIIKKRNIKITRYKMIPRNIVNYEDIGKTWPGIDKAIIKSGCRKMRFYAKILDKKTIITSAEYLLNKQGAFSRHSVPALIPDKYQHAINHIDFLFEKGINIAKLLLTEIYISNGKYMEKEKLFKLNFEGIVVDE